MLRGFAVALVIALAGCGGGGGGGDGASPQQTEACTAPVLVRSDASVPVGKTAGAAIAGCTGRIASVEWTQLAGPAVALLSHKTQAISFDIPELGEYRFRAAYVPAGGAASAIDVTIRGVAATAPLSVRADQAVREGGTLSVRAFTASGAVSWTQIEGPPVALDTSQPSRLLVVAPEVERDTFLRFRASTSGTSTDSDDVIIVVEDYPQAAAATGVIFGGRHVARTYPYRANGPYAGALVPCAYDPPLRFRSAADSTLCPLARLPFIGTQPNGPLPSVEQVMERVAVSHDWMAEVFEDFLLTQDASGDIRRMLNSVTAIVIANHLRPSFYNAGTAAIYLDAGTLWQTASQRDTVDETPDPRSASADELKYRRLARYVRGNALATGSYPIERRLTRSAADLAVGLAALLYHELTHASDYLPPGALGALRANVSAWENIFPRRPVSEDLASTLPLLSSELRELAQVYFSFEPTPATDAQKSYTPAQVGGFFSADRANDAYSYVSNREDAAMLVEEFLMARRLGVRRDVAFVDAFPSNASAADVNALPVRWGERGRVGTEAIKPRVKAVIARTMPWVAASEVDSLAAPVGMRVGETWELNLSLP